jgi:hypothetical protein
MKLHYVVKTQKYFVRSAAGDPYDEVFHVSELLCAPEVDVTLIDSQQAYEQALSDSRWSEESTPYGDEDEILRDAASESIRVAAEERAKVVRLGLGDEVSWEDNGVTYKGYVVHIDLDEDEYWCVSRSYVAAETSSRELLRYFGPGYKPGVTVKKGHLRGRVTACRDQFVVVEWLYVPGLPSELYSTAHPYLDLEITSG